MFDASLLVLGGLVALAIGGELLVRGAVGIAQKLGISNLVTGLVIVGAATSMPEMVASVEAALIGSPEIAWGNIVGSNLANTLLILGATALIAPIVLSGLGRRDAVVAVLVTLLAWGLTFAQIGNAIVGIMLLIGLIAYIVWRYRHPRGDDDEEESAPSNIWIALLLFALGVGALIIGGKWLVQGAVVIATQAGISETVIGMTVVAIGTSLPELAASAAAAFRGKPGLAIGNVLGSNIYNILLIGGVTMIVAPMPIPFELADLEWGLVAGSAVMLWLLLWKAREIGRGLGFVLLAAFGAANAIFLLG